MSESDNETEKRKIKNCYEYSILIKSNSREFERILVVSCNSLLIIADCSIQLIEYSRYFLFLKIILFYSLVISAFILFAIFNASDQCNQKKTECGVAKEATARNLNG